MEGNGGSLEDGAEAFVLFLRSAQLVLQSSVLAVLDPDEVNVTLEDAEIFGSVLSGEGGSVGGGWRCCGSALSCPLPLLRNQPRHCYSVAFCVRGDKSNRYSIRTAGGKPIFV